MRKNQILILAMVLMIVGCTTNPLAPPTIYHGTPSPNPENPDTIQPPVPPGIIAVYATTSVRIHEAQSHATIATLAMTGVNDSLQLSVPVQYETGRSQANENWHAYLRSTSDFNQKYDFTFPPTGTQVVPDPTNVDGWLTRTMLIGRVPTGNYELVVQQDLPNGHHPGESDITFGVGTATVYRR